MIVPVKQRRTDVLRIYHAQLTSGHIVLYFQGQLPVIEDGLSTERLVVYIETPQRHRRRRLVVPVVCTS